jgi:hypothetical protein
VAPPAAAEWLKPAEREYRIAARYAPEFRQLVDPRHPRFDYLTCFDFDGNWRGDDNWRNAANPEIPLPAYVYAAVSETRTHFFIHYVYFHPRDWKGNWLTNSTFQTAKFLGRLLLFPRKLGLEMLALAHENDLQGVLVVVKREDAYGIEGRTVLVEAFSHHRFHTYIPLGRETEFVNEAKPVQVQQERPVLFIESRGHGVQPSLEPRRGQSILAYTYRGVAETPFQGSNGPIGYDLLLLYDTLWQQALRSEPTNRVFSRFQLYDKFELADFFDGDRQRVGTALRGRKRGLNRALAPWAWNNNGVRGQWFFDPARNIALRHQPRGDFDTRYLFTRFLALATPADSTAAPLAPAPPAGLPSELRRPITVFR